MSQRRSLSQKMNGAFKSKALEGAHVQRRDAQLDGEQLLSRRPSPSGPSLLKLAYFRFQTSSPTRSLGLPMSLFHTRDYALSGPPLARFCICGSFWLKIYRDPGSACSTATHELQGCDCGKRKILSSVAPIRPRMQAGLLVGANYSRSGAQTRLGKRRQSMSL